MFRINEFRVAQEHGIYAYDEISNRYLQVSSIDFKLSNGMIASIKSEQFIKLLEDNRDEFFDEVGTSLIMERDHDFVSRMRVAFDDDVQDEFGRPFKNCGCHYKHPLMKSFW